jgi:Phosphotransferase enzyme family
VSVDAIEAARRCARQLGLDAEDPVVLRATNNTVVWLAPLPIVAKVGTGHYDRLATEIEVANLLSAAGAPAVPPADGIPVRVHRVETFEMTFWRYEPQDGVTDPDSRSVAAALARLHEALSRLKPPANGWPPFDQEANELQSRLDNENFAPELRDDDRGVLQQALAGGVRQLQEAAPTEQVLHGSPHRLNVLVVKGSPRFIDFETVCEGPTEWDLAHLEPEVADHYPLPLDHHVLKTCRLIVSAKTAAWCWHSIHAGPDMPFHANHHLQVVRDATA